MEYREIVNRIKQTAGNQKETRIDAHSVKICCPVHRDINPSLQVSDRNGKTLIKCHAGCNTRDILSAVGLTFKDLEPEQIAITGEGPDMWSRMLFPFKNRYGDGVHITATYDFTDESGKYLYSKVRFEGGGIKGKEIRYYTIDRRAGTYKKGKPKEVATLYNLPQLIEAVKNGETVYYVEGEKDVETLRKIGLTATTAGGVKDWKTEYAQYFQGADCVILPDNDTQGLELAERVKKDLAGIADRIIVVKTSTAPKGDISDYLSEGHGAEDLQKLVESAPDVNEMDLSRFHLLNDKGKPIKPFDDAIEREIKAKYPLFVMGGVPYLFREGAYIADLSGAELCSIIKKYLFPEFVTANTLKRIYGLFLIDADLVRTYEEVNQYPESWIIFRNCAIDGRTGERHELGPELYALNQIPWDYVEDPEVDGHYFSDFLRDAVGPDDMKTVLQYLGLCLTRDNTFQKFVLLRGSRGTGKSVLLSVFQMILGRENYASVPLQNIEDRFSKVQLLGKLVDICGDLPATALQTVSTIKQITGGDVLFAEFKGRDGFSFKPYARLIFSCNTAPKNLDEKSNAFFERLIIIEMDHRPENPDRTLTQKIEKEIPWIIREAVRAVQEVYADNRIYESTASKEKVQDLYAESDSVTAFLSEKVERSVTGKIKTSELHEKYKEYCEQEEREPLSRNGFYSNIRGKGIGRKTVNGTAYFFGIAFKGGNDFEEFHPYEEFPFK